MISDTHRRHEEVTIPDGDMLIFAGDGDFRTKSSLEPFLEWFSGHPHKHKVMIAGNHDFFFEQEMAAILTYDYDIIYLEGFGVEIEGLKIWGSPITPTFGNWAFMKERGNEIAKEWAKIPENTDIIITHGPPMHIMDKVFYNNESVGCWDLAQKIKEIKPKLHIFGHIHSQEGVLEKDGTIYVNASVVDEEYQCIYEPKVVDL